MSNEVLGGNLGDLDPTAEFAARAAFKVDLLEELEIVKQGLDILSQRLFELEGRQKTLWAELVGSSWSAVGQSLKIGEELIQQSVYHTAILQAILDILSKKRNLNKRDLQTIYNKGTEAVETFKKCQDLPFQPSEDTTETSNESKKPSRTASKTKRKS